MKPTFRPLLLGLIALAVLPACTAPGLPAVHLAGTPGFWMGLWHGMIFPVTFVVSLFNTAVGVYAAVNDGGWYNFGFFLGLAMSMGGGAGASARGRRKKQDEESVTGKSQPVTPRSR